MDVVGRTFRLMGDRHSVVMPMTPAHYRGEARPQVQVSVDMPLFLRQRPNCKFRAARI